MLRDLEAVLKRFGHVAAYTAVPKFPVKREHGGIWSRDDRD